MSLVKLKDICQVNPPKEIVDGKVSFLRMEDVSVDGTILNKQIKDYDEVSKGFSAFKDNDILVAKITPCFENGKCAYVEKLSNGVGFGSTEFHVLRADESKLLSKYLFYQVNSETFRKYGEINMTGSAGQKREPKSFIEQYKIYLPNIKEQQKIVEILSIWDLTIEKQQQLIEKKKELKKGLIQRLLSGEVRFKEFNDEWENKEIGNYIEEYKEKSTVSNQYPVLTSSRNGIVLQTDYFKDNQVTTNDNIGYNIIPKEYITFRTRSDDGTFVFNQNKIIDMGIVSYFYPVFKFNEEINTYFAITWLNNCIDRQIRREIVGTSQLVLSLNKLKKFKINLPSLEEQNKIAEVFKTADKEIELLEKELEALKLQKKGLMQRLFTGEVRVKVD